MLTREELQKESLALGFTLWQAERDYLQHLVLLFLSKKIDNELIFKGGTALQKTFGLNRFSIDLDFTKNTALSLDFFPQIAEDMTHFGFDTKIKEDIHKDSLTVKVVSKGPLYQQVERTLAVLRVEISLRENVLVKPQTKEIFPVYYDLQPYVLNIMHPEEILAEKIRAIFTRKKARDVFDLRFLLQKEILLKEELIQKKLLPYALTYSRKKLFEEINIIESIWQSELNQLVTVVPAFSRAKKDIEEKLFNMQENKK